MIVFCETTKTYICNLLIKDMLIYGIIMTKKMTREIVCIRIPYHDRFNFHHVICVLETHTDTHKQGA